MRSGPILDADEAVVGLLRVLLGATAVGTSVKRFQARAAKPSLLPEGERKHLNPFATTAWRAPERTPPGWADSCRRATQLRFARSQCGSPQASMRLRASLRRAMRSDPSATRSRLSATTCAGDLAMFSGFARNFSALARSLSALLISF